MRILIFEDNEGLRSSIKLLLSTEPDFELVGDFNSADEIVSILQDLKPEVIIMDIDMPGISGIDAVRLAKSENPLLEIIMLTVFEDDEKLYASLCAGASGYLLKMQSLSRLPDSIREVMKGGAPMSPGIARRMIQHFQEKAPKDYHLTEREKEILSYLIKGYSYKMIALACSISGQTVKTHLKNIYKKLHVSCATEAVAKVLLEKLI